MAVTNGSGVTEIPTTRPTKGIVVTKEINGIIYDLMIRTHANQVYTDPNNKITLTQTLVRIFDLFTEYGGRLNEALDAIQQMAGDAPDTMNSFKKVWEYINVHGDPKSELIQLIDSKISNVDGSGKGLSECDFTRVLYEKLVNDYTPQQIDEKFSFTIGSINASIDSLSSNINAQLGVIRRDIDDLEGSLSPHAVGPNLYISTVPPSSDQISNGSFWFQIIENVPKEGEDSGDSETPVEPTPSPVDDPDAGVDDDI